MSQTSASKEGKHLLKKYREGKNSNRKLSKISSDAEEDGYFEAVADGSRLAMVYSETKRKVSTSFSTHFEEAGSEKDVSPLDTLRIALLKLNDVTGNQSTVSNVSTMLQDVEDYLEKHASSKSRVNARLAYSAEKKRTRPDMLFSEETDIFSSEPRSPSVGDKSNLFLQRSVFMENQLDLNESELEYYEGVINELADKLEMSNEARNALQEENEILNTTLMAKSSEMHTLQQHVDKLQQNVDNLNKKLCDEEDRSAQLQLELRKASTLSSSQLADAQAVILSYDEKLHGLEERLEHEQAVSQQLRLEAQNNNNLKLIGETTMSKSNATESDVDDDAADLHNQIQDLQMELDDNRSEIDHLVSIIEDLRGKLDDIRLDDKITSSGATQFESELRAEIRELQAQLANSRKENELLASEQDRLHLLVTSLSEVNADKVATLESKEKRDLALFGSSNALSTPTGKANVRPIDASASLPATPLRDVSRSFINAGFVTPVNANNNSLSENPRSLMRVYMDNQLDLNESEMQYYENVVNELAERVERLQEEKMQLQQCYDALLDSNSSASVAIEELRATLASKQEELDYVNELFEGLSVRLEERDSVIATLKAQENLFSTQNEGESQMQEQIQLTNEFLGINDDDAANDFDDSLTDSNHQPLKPSSNMSFVDPNLSRGGGAVVDESFSQFSDAEELRRLLRHRDQQVKVQISQLQSLQDNLSEQKAAISTLKQQKAALKSAVEEQRNQSETLAHQELDALTLVKELQSRLHLEENRSNELQSQCEDLDAKAELLKRTVEDLRVKNTEYRLLLEQHHEKSDREGLHTPAKSTPSRDPQQHLLLDHSFSSQHNTSFTSAITPLKQRLLRTETEVDELTQQLRHAAKAKEDVQLELERSNIRYQSKTRQVDDLTRDLQLLQEELDSRLQELDRLKLQDMKIDAANSLRQIDCDVEIEQLHERVAVLENTINELSEALLSETAELQKERQESAALRSLLDGFGSRDDQMEDLVSELRREHETLVSQLSMASSERQHTATLLAQYESENEDLQSRLRLMETDIAQKDFDFIQHKRILEQEAQTIESNLNNLHRDSENHTEVLERRLEALRQEKDETESRLHSQIHRLEHELSVGKVRVSELDRTAAGVAEVVQYYMRRLLKLEESLLDHVDQKAVDFERRVERATESLQFVVTQSFDTVRESTLSREMVEAALLDSQSALRKALLRHDEDAIEKDELWRRYQDTLREMDDIKALLTDARHEIDNRSAAAVDDEFISSAEYVRLTDRLAEAEQRAVSMSTEGAKAFARSVKTIAYLEGETCRLNSMLDHFRAVNAKLSCDLKVAHVASAEGKSLEHRMRRMIEDETAQKERIATLESTIIRKDKELLEAMGTTNLLEEQFASRFETELNRISEALQSSQETAGLLKKENEELRLEMESNEANLRREIENSQQSLRMSEKENQTQRSMHDDILFEMRQLQTVLSEKEHHCAQYETRVSLLQQELSMSHETHQSIAKDLTNEIQEKQSRIKVLETSVSSLRLKTVELESVFNQRDEEITQKLLRRATCDEENRELRAANERFTEEIGALGIRNEELQYRLNELNRQHSVLVDTSAQKADMLREVSQKLAICEDASQRFKEDADTLRPQLAAQRKELTETRESLQRVENNLSTLKTSFMELQTSEQMLRVTNDSLVEETAYLRKEVEGLIGKLTSSSAQMAAMRSQLSDQQEMIKDLEDLSREYETKIKNAKARIIALDNSESAIAADIRAYCDSMYVGGGSSSSHFTFTATSSSSVSTVSKFSIGKDLFSSPPLTVGRSSARSPHDSVQSEDVSGSLSQIRQTFDALRSKSEGLVHNYNALHDAHDKARKEIEELIRKRDKVNEKLQLVTADRDELVSKLHLSEQDVVALSNANSAAKLVHRSVLATEESVCQRSNAIVCDLENSLLEALSKANDAVAGIVPIDTDAIPNLSGTKTMIRRSDDHPRSTSAVDESGSSVVTEVVTVISTAAGEVDRATAYLVDIIGALVRVHNKCRGQLDKFELSFDVKERNWDKDRSILVERIADLETKLVAETSKLSLTMIEVESQQVELVRVRHQLSDANRSISELETELKSVIEQSTDLKTVLNESEALCIDLRGRIRSLQSEYDQKIGECSSANDQLEAVYKRVSDCDLALEKTNTLLGRIRAEKDALDNVRRSLESELDRYRSELSTLRAQVTDRDEVTRTAFELEKLLAALGTTLDQVLVTSPADDQKMSTDVVSVQNNTSAVDSVSSLSVRVDEAVRRLTLLRSSSREEARNRRQLLSQHDALAQDFISAQRTTEDMHRQLKRAMTSISDRENELRDKVRELSESQHHVLRLQEEVARCNKERAVLSESLELERSGKQKQLIDRQLRESDVSRLQLELEKRDLSVGKLSEQISLLKDELREAQLETERRNEQLKAVKLNNERMISTIEQLERGVESERLERANSERKLLETENTNATVSRLKTRVHEIESQLTAAYEENRILAQSKSVSDELKQRSIDDSEAARKRIASLEARIETILLEKNSFVGEISETRRKIAAAKEQAELERQKRMNLEAEATAKRRVGDEKRLYIEEFTAKNQEIELRTSLAEEEKRSLRIKISELKSVCDEKESAFAAEASDRAKLERDIKQLKASLQKKTQDLKVSADYSSRFRVEGRNARKQVLDAANQIREIVNMVRIDAHSVGIEVSSPESKIFRSGGEFDEESLSQGLSEALGISELVIALEGLRRAIGFVKEVPKNYSELDFANKRLESECNALKKDLRAVEHMKNEQALLYKQELQALQLQITDSRRSDNKNPHLTHQIAVLESSLKQERERRERLSAENDKLHSKLEGLSQEQLNSRPKFMLKENIQSELDILQKELHRQKVEYSQLTHELDAVNHHRTVLRDTVEQMDKQLRAKIDETTCMRYSIEASSANCDELEDVDALRRQVQRFKAKAAAIDELASTYRVSVLALYADGASYGAAQFGWQAHGLPQEFHTRGVHLIGVGWIEREITTVRHSFEDEVRLLDDEVGELRGKLQQSHSYIAELRRHFEDSMKAMFRSGKVTQQEGYMQQFDQLRLALEASDVEIQSLQKELGEEKAHRRHRHVQLIDELTHTLQARDAALSALHRLEKFCVERDVDIAGLAIYETLKSELVSGTARPQHQSDVVHSLMRGLVESDHELAESDRRDGRRRHREAESKQSHTRSSSHGSGHGGSRLHHSSGYLSASSGVVHTTTASRDYSSSSAQHRAHNETSGHVSSTVADRSPPVKQQQQRQQQQQQPSYRSSPPREGKHDVGSSSLETRLTESFLTSQQQQLHSSSNNAHHQAFYSHSTTRQDSNSSIVANNGFGNTSYHVHTVGHNTGSGSLRVSKVNTTTTLLGDNNTRR